MIKENEAVNFSYLIKCKGYEGVYHVDLCIDYHLKLYSNINKMEANRKGISLV